MRSQLRGKTLEGKQIALLLATYYFIYTMGTAAHQVLIPLLLKEANISEFGTGAIMAMVPIFTIISPMVWGNLCDKSKSKNIILIGLLALSGVFGLLFLFKLGFVGFLIIISTFFFFNAALFPITDAVVLETGNKYGFHFNPVRMCATIGYTVMVLINGQLSLHTIFLVSCVLYVVSIIPLLPLPTVSGQRTKGKKFNILAVVTKKPVIMLYFVIFIINMTYGFHSAFFPSYFVDNIGNEFELSIVIFMTPLLEIVFFAFAHKIAKVVDIRIAVTFGIVIMGLRWFVYSYSENFITLALWALTQGVGMLAPYYYCMRYTAQITPPEGSTTIQTVNFIVFSGISRAAGSLIGGVSVPLIGYQNSYFISGIICMVAAAIFLLSRTKFEKLV